MNSELDPVVARWLVSEAASSVIADAVAGRAAGVGELDLLERIRARGVDPAAASAVVGCAASAGPPGSVFTREAAEQASPPQAAAWRAGRFEGADRIIDLCCGAGGDAIALGGVAPVVCVDTDESRTILARHNTAAAGVDARVVVADALRAPFDAGAPVHADPARRAGGQRVKSAAAYRPGLDSLLQAHARAPGMCVLLSPAVALDDPALPADGELEFIQIGPDLVECALWTGSLKGPNAATATLLPGGLSIGRAGPPARLPAGALGAYLIEAVPAAVRARVHETLGAQAGMRKVARRRALMTADADPGESPWWRRWRVEQDMPLRARTIAAWLRRADPLPLEISLHGHQADVEALWRALGKPERGPQGRRLFVVRMDDGVRAIACSPA